MTELLIKRTKYEDYLLNASMAMILSAFPIAMLGGLTTIWISYDLGIKIMQSAAAIFLPSMILAYVLLSRRQIVK